MKTTYRNVLILGALFLFIEVFYSACRKDMGCRCPKPTTWELRISDVVVSNVDTLGKPFLDGMDFQNYRVKIDLVIEKTKLSMNNCPNSGLFFPNLYACKCIGLIENRIKYISKVKIVSHSHIWGVNAGDTLTNLDDYLNFYVRHLSGNRTSYNYHQFLESNVRYFESNSYFIEFKHINPAIKELDFEFIFHFSDGTSKAYRPGLVKFY